MHILNKIFYVKIDDRDVCGLVLWPATPQLGKGLRNQNNQGQLYATKVEKEQRDV